MPMHVEPNKINEIPNGICSRSGEMRSNGRNTMYHRTIPIKSLVNRWELSENVFFMCANPGMTAPTSTLVAWPPLYGHQFWGHQRRCGTGTHQ